MRPIDGFLGGSSGSEHELVRELEQENEQLQEALAQRVVIEQAKGAVSARFGVLPAEAFELIRGLARSQGRALHEFAGEIVEHGGRLDGGENAVGDRIFETHDGDP